MRVWIVSMAAFNFIFLPPIYTVSLADSRNWFALAVFLVTAVVVSELGKPRTYVQVGAVDSLLAIQGFVLAVASALEVERRTTVLLSVAAVFDGSAAPPVHF